MEAAVAEQLTFMMEEDFKEPFWCPTRKFSSEGLYFLSVAEVSEARGMCSMAESEPDTGNLKVSDRSQALHHLTWVFSHSKPLTSVRESKCHLSY